MTSADRCAVVFDEHPLWVDAIAGVLERVGVRVVARAHTPAEALAALERHEATLFVTDLDVGDQFNVVEWLREAHRRRPDAKVIVLSDHAEPEYIDDAFAGGAVAYVVKTAHPDDIASAIRQAFDSSIYYAAARRHVAAALPAPPANANGALTRRELEILQLVAEGKSNAQVAQQLWVTEQTVKFHLSNIYRKLGVSNRTEASRAAHARGLLHAAETV